MRKVVRTWLAACLCLVWSLPALAQTYEHQFELDTSGSMGLCSISRYTSGCEALYKYQVSASIIYEVMGRVNSTWSMSLYRWDEDRHFVSFGQTAIRETARQWRDEMSPIVSDQLTTPTMVTNGTGSCTHLIMLTDALFSHSERDRVVAWLAQNYMHTFTTFVVVEALGGPSWYELLESQVSVFPTVTLFRIRTDEDLVTSYDWLVRRMAEVEQRTRAAPDCQLVGL